MRRENLMRPLIIRSGINTAISETEIDMMVKANLNGAFERSLKRLFTVLDVARYVLEHYDRVVHDKAHGDGEGHQRQIVDAVARRP